MASVYGRLRCRKKERQTKPSKGEEGGEMKSIKWWFNFVGNIGGYFPLSIFTISLVVCLIGLKSEENWFLFAHGVMVFSFFIFGYLAFIIENGWEHFKNFRKNR